MENPHTPTPVENLQDDANWLAWLDNPSAEDVQRLEDQQKRDVQVGELLRELHYLEQSEPPKRMAPAQTEEDYWTGRAQMSPGYEIDSIRAELARRNSGSHQPADFDSMQSPERRLRGDIVALVDIGLRGFNMNQTNPTLTKEAIEAAVRKLFQEKILGQGGRQPSNEAVEIAVKMMVRRTMREIEGVNAPAPKPEQ
jgi:hypothetical protein